MEKYKIAACILHYGDPSLTGRLYGQLEAEPDVYILDNAAPDPFPGAWKRLDENLFWAGAFAWALREFEYMGYTHLWFFNNDAYFLSRPPYIKTAAVRLARMELALGRGKDHNLSIPFAVAAATWRGAGFVAARGGPACP